MQGRRSVRQPKSEKRGGDRSIASPDTMQLNLGSYCNYCQGRMIDLGWAARGERFSAGFFWSSSRVVRIT